MAPLKRPGKRLKNGEGSATGKMASPPPLDDRPLCLDDATCKICLNIMIKPVTMPCKHAVCSLCFDSCLEKANLSCPMCRKRISVWCRQSKNTSIVDEKLWERIKEQFPDKVTARLEGKDSDDLGAPVEAMHQFAEPGEILKEYETELERVQREQEEQRLLEEKKSAELLAELAKEEEAENSRAAELSRIYEEDEALAQLLSSEAGDSVAAVATPPTSRKRPRKSKDSAGSQSKRRISSFFLSGPSSASRSASSSSRSARASPASSSVSEYLPKSSEGDDDGSDSRSCSVASLQSIDMEVSRRIHFRPINAAPLTPTKDPPHVGRIVKPQVVTGTARSLFVDESGEENMDVDVNANGTASDCNRSLAEELQKLERQWLEKKLQQEEADCELARRLQKEMDDESRGVINRSKGTSDEYKLRSKSRKQSTIEDSFQIRPVRKSSMP